MQSDLLFVYGTLKKNSQHPIAIAFHNKSTFIGTTQLSGCLYRVAWYPAAIFNSNELTSVIHGDIFQINDLSIWNVLNEFEGVNEASPQYKKRLIEIIYNEKPLNVWVYEYIQDIKGLEVISSGNFIPE